MDAANGDGQALNPWTCSRCGAALPQPDDQATVIYCSHCGTPFQIPAHLSGGVTIDAGTVRVGGSVYTGDVIRTPYGTLAVPGGSEQSQGVSIQAGTIEIGGDIVGGRAIVYEPVAKSHSKRGWWQRFIDFWRR